MSAAALFWSRALACIIAITAYNVALRYPALKASIVSLQILGLPLPTYPEACTVTLWRILCCIAGLPLLTVRCILVSFQFVAHFIIVHVHGQEFPSTGAALYAALAGLRSSSWLRCCT